MKTKTLTGKSLVLAAALGVSLVSAVQQASANAIYTLGTTDISIPGGGPYATAEIDLTSSTTANIIFTGLTSPGSPFDKFGIGNPALNVNGTGFTVSNVKEDGVSISDSTSSGNEDGFGSFNLIVDTSNNGSSSYLQKVSFTLTDSTADWLTATSVVTGNDQGSLLASHVFVFNSDGTPAGLTGFIHDSSVTTITGNGGVPDGASTVTLLGMALTGMGLLRKKLVKS